jgi:4'-phosphopantetheinyl transferase
VIADLDLAQRLCGFDVHVWVVNLDTSDIWLRELSSTLSPDERDRADSFAFEHLRKRFSASRGLLRTFLGMYLAISPRAVEFSYGKYGKPSLAGLDRFQFNVAHSEDMAVYAFALGCELGVDIERIRHITDTGAIARHFFSCEEAADLESVEFPKRLDSFFACWTRKEAYIKATGEGLSAPLQAFRVALRPSETPSFMHMHGNTSEAQFWSLHSLRPNDSYIGALAFRDRRNLRLSSYQPLEYILEKMASRNFSVDDCLDRSL